MPIYTYRCENCGVQFERQQKFADQPLTWCPECNKKALRKVYLPVGIVFKGKGFYATDHRSPSGQTPRSTKSSESEKSGESEGKNESSTPATKTEPAPTPSETTSKD
jgi:putative FmdB family regulatory protein